LIISADHAPYKLVSRASHPENTVIKVGDVAIGAIKSFSRPAPVRLKARLK
jgi:hypothetical protein